MRPNTVQIKMRQKVNKIVSHTFYTFYRPFVFLKFGVRWGALEPFVARQGKFLASLLLDFVRRKRGLQQFL